MINHIILLARLWWFQNRFFKKQLWANI